MSQVSTRDYGASNVANESTPPYPGAHFQPSEVLP